MPSVRPSVFNQRVRADVETEEQRRMVLEEGCPQARGFYFGSPAEAVIGIPGLLRFAS